jgi:hypothetical protein
VLAADHGWTLLEAPVSAIRDVFCPSCERKLGTTDERDGDTHNIARRAYMFINHWRRQFCRWG